MMINGTVVKHWSRTQATRALSTAEAEYYAVVTGAAEGLGMQSMIAQIFVCDVTRSTNAEGQHNDMMMWTNVQMT